MTDYTKKEIVNHLKYLIENHNESRKQLEIKVKEYHSLEDGNPLKFKDEGEEIAFRYGWTRGTYSSLIKALEVLVK